MNARDLPVYELEDRLTAALARGNRLVLEAPTGSGKSTQIPPMLLAHGFLEHGRAVVLQPRRLATRLLAARVARERGAQLGAEVGYQIRFEDVSSPATRIKYETEGILLRQMLSRPRLDDVAVVVFDEFHERHLYGDLTLARVLDLQERERPDLKIIVMSATLDGDALERYLAPCARLASAGRTFPVNLEYLPRPVSFDDEPVWDVATRELERLVRQGLPGDALVFLPGAYEIQRAVQALRVSALGSEFVILPLHGELAPSDQDAAVARYDRRKIVVATNVAETSLTIEGVGIVVDSGLARMARFDPYRGINTLLIEKISCAAADQRAGRAGRTGPGHCLRLWTAREHAERPRRELPEVRRLDLAEVVLVLKAGGVDDLRAFRWLEPPDPRALDRAELLLRDLGALDPRTGALTELGRRMPAFPVHPRYARMLLEAGTRGCVRTVALIAALTQGRNLLLRGAGREVRADRETLLGDDTVSDFFTLMRAWNYADRHGYQVEPCRRVGVHAQAARQVRPLWDFFLQTAATQGLPVEQKPADDAAVCQCVLVGFSDQVARRADGGTRRCLVVHGRKGELAADSAVRGHPLVVASEIHEIETAGRGIEVRLSLVTAIEEAWLRELYPGDFSAARTAVYDPESRRVFGVDERRFRDLVLGARRHEQPPPAEAARLLADEVAAGRLRLPRWDHAVEQWIARVNGLAQWCPELGLAPITAADERAILEQVCLGAVSYKEIKDRPVAPLARGRLSGAQQALVEKHAPERIALPGGRHARIQYGAGAEPCFAARIQDLYGLRLTPRIAMGRVPLVAQILAPNQRPVQITRDLAGFWREHYPRIRQELCRKYPKHEWR